MGKLVSNSPLQCHLYIRLQCVASKITITTKFEHSVPYNGLNYAVTSNINVALVIYTKLLLR
jgi:hypothetical protein